jgi:hypothetical protein
MISTINVVAHEQKARRLELGIFIVRLHYVRLLEKKEEVIKLAVDVTADIYRGGKDEDIWLPR